MRSYAPALAYGDVRAIITSVTVQFPLNGAPIFSFQETDVVKLAAGEISLSGGATLQKTSRGPTQNDKFPVLDPVTGADTGKLASERSILMDLLSLARVMQNARDVAVVDTPPGTL